MLISFFFVIRFSDLYNRLPYLMNEVEDFILIMINHTNAITCELKNCDSHITYITFLNVGINYESTKDAIYDIQVSFAY